MRIWKKWFIFHEFKEKTMYHWVATSQYFVSFLELYMKLKPHLLINPQWIKKWKNSAINNVYSRNFLKMLILAFEENTAYSSEIRGLRSTKYSREMLQNLLYFMYNKTHVVFFVFHFVLFYILAHREDLDVP